MEREHRYIVLKSKDIQNALTKAERTLLEEFCAKARDYRERIGKQPLECVVVESDWPEYGPTWAAIEARVDAEVAARPGAGGAVLD